MTYIEDEQKEATPKPSGQYNVEGINTLLNVNHLTPTKLIEQQVKVRSAIQTMIESSIK